MARALIFTRGPWKWRTNGWKRLKRDDHGITQNVLEPYVCSDGHPDLYISEADMALIAAAPDLFNALRNLFGAMDQDEALWERFELEMTAAGDAINKAIGEN